MRDIDGFVLPIPKKSLAAYRKVARLAGKVWSDDGALDYVECVADDVPPGKLTSFPLSVNLEQDELVVFSWIVSASRAQRDRVYKHVTGEPRIASMNPELIPFDGKRMIHGRFKTLVEL